MAEQRELLIAAIGRNLLAAAGAVVAIIGVITIIFSPGVKGWVKAHGILVYYGLLALLLIALVAINFIRLAKARLASEHDRRVVSQFLAEMPSDGPVITWLKQNTVANGIPFEYLDIIENVYGAMNANVIGLDNRAANKAYRELAETMEKFRVFVALNTFPDKSYRRVWISDSWDWKARKEAAEHIESDQAAVVTAYDHFLLISHKDGLDRPTT